jgi:hypothetical protein
MAEELGGDARCGIPAYIQQMARTYRFLDRYKTSRNIPIDVEPERFNELEDFLWAFFQNCWHINDWIRHDESLPKTLRDAVSEDVKINTAILMAADLANGMKHFSRKSEREKVGAQCRQISAIPNADYTWLFDHEISLRDGTRHSALEAGEAAMNAWSEILCRHGMHHFPTEKA